MTYSPLALPLILLSACADNLGFDSALDFKPSGDDEAGPDDSGTICAEDCAGVIVPNPHDSTTGLCVSFTERHDYVGLASDASMPHVAVSVNDYDDDGDLDLYFSNNGSSGNELYQQTAGIFSAMQSKAELDLTGYSRAAAWKDYDSDGDEDVLVAGENGTKLFKNSAGVFSAPSSGGISESALATAAAWIGTNIYITGENGARFYVHSTGDSFGENVATSYGVNDPGQGSSIAVTQYNGDAYDDFYVANASGENRCFISKSDGTYSSEENTLNITGNTYAVSTKAEWVEFSEGVPSLSLANYGSVDNLFLNSGDNTFTDQAPQYGVSDAGDTTTAVWTSLDSDFPPFPFIGNTNVQHAEQTNLFYVPVFNDDGSVDYYEEVGAQFGMDEAMQTMDAAWFDADKDNDKDLVVVGYEGNVRLFRNDSQTVTGCE